MYNVYTDSVLCQFPRLNSNNLPIHFRRVHITTPADELKYIYVSLIWMQEVKELRKIVVLMLVNNLLALLRLSSVVKCFVHITMNMNVVIKLACL